MEARDVEHRRGVGRRSAGGRGRGDLLARCVARQRHDGEAFGHCAAEGERSVGRVGRQSRVGAEHKHELVERRHESLRRHAVRDGDGAEHRHLAERVNGVEVQRRGVGGQARQVERDLRAVGQADDLRAPVRGGERRPRREVNDDLLARRILYDRPGAVRVLDGLRLRGRDGRLRERDGGQRRD